MNEKKVDKEGWLMKKGKKRYFILSSGRLTWLTHPLGKPKGLLEIADYNFSVQQKKEEKLLVFEPKNRATAKKKKDYTITSKVEQDILDWEKAIKSAYDYKTSVYSPKMDLTRTGWLEKKGKKRFFILKDGILYWFNNEQLVDSDLKKTMNGCLELFECRISEGDVKYPKILIATKSGKNYLLTTKTKNEMEEWIRDLLQAQKKIATHSKERIESIALSKNISKQGYLTKKGKMRFFVLNHGVLQWYLNEKQEKPKGTLLLPGCSVAPLQNKRHTFLIINPDGKNYELTAELSQEMEEWITLLKLSCNIDRNSASRTGTSSEYELKKASTHFITNRKLAVSEEVFQTDSEGLASITKRGWLKKKGQKRYFILHGSVLLWFTKEQPEKYNKQLAQGVMTLKGAVVQKLFDQFSFLIRNINEVERILTASTTIEVNEWIEKLEQSIQLYKNRFSISAESGKESELKTGWMEKKGLQRFFVLTEGMLRWYEVENINTKPKGSLPLSGCFLNEVTKDSFSIQTPNKKKYFLKCVSEGEASQWITWIRQEIYRDNHLLESGFQKWGWLEKKLQKRWFVLKEGTLMWFSEQQTFSNSVIENANNSILTIEYTVQMNNDCTFILTPKQEKAETYTLKAKTESEAQAWVQALLKSQTFIKQPQKGRVFGIPLDKLEMNENGIPVFMEKVILYLVNNGLDVEGIFRLSGNSKRIAALRELINKGEPYKFIENNEEDIHAAAGLLKAFLRELTEPLLTFNLYQPLIEAGENLQTISNLIQSLPQLNLNITKYLFHFISAINSHSVTNHMVDSNLAIVFGPNLLRSSSSSIVELTNTPKIISLICTLIKNSSHFFGKSPFISNENSDEKGEWKEAVAPDGNKYYFHSVTRESSWNLPEDLRKSGKGESKLDNSGEEIDAQSDIFGSFLAESGSLMIKEKSLVPLSFAEDSIFQLEPDAQCNSAAIFVRELAETFESHPLLVSFKLQSFSEAQKKFLTISKPLLANLSKMISAAKSIDPGVLSKTTLRVADACIPFLSIILEITRLITLSEFQENLILTTKEILEAIVEIIEIAKKVITEESQPNLQTLSASIKEVTNSIGIIANSIKNPPEM